MDNYEKLKESKVIYEYINDILQNGNLEMRDDYLESLNKTISIMAEIYENSHFLMQKNTDENKLLETDLNCPHCSKNVVLSDIITYEYLCEKCDENFYLSEGDLNYEWYYDNKRKKDMLNNSYTIRIWKTEELRDIGESFNYFETFYNKDDAINEAKMIMSRENYAYLEVLDNKDKLIFGTDGINEEYYKKQKYQTKIYKVSPEELKEYIDRWTEKKELNLDYSLLYCQEGNFCYVAVDNSSGECFVEEFEKEAQAIYWLDTKIEAEYIPFTVISKDILELSIDTTKNNSMRKEI